MKQALLIAATAAAVALPLAAPADAQYREPRSRSGRAAEIAREIRDAADAVGVVTDAVADSVNGIRWRSEQRFAIDRCAPRVARYGRMHVEHVEPYGRRSMRVWGTTDLGGYGRYGSDRARSFTCTVREDGRVKLRTRRLA